MSVTTLANGSTLKALLRLIGAGAAALAVTGALYWLMAELVAAGREALTEAPKGRIVDFVRLKKDPNLELDRPKPEKPPKPETPPPDVTPPETKLESPQANTVAIGPMSVDPELSRLGFGLSASDGEYLPIVKVAPLYPRRAQERGIEGWVLLRFTVTETGSVRDPAVLEAQPAGIFDDAAKKAVLKFKYKPRVEGGTAVEVKNVEHLITFEIEK